ncbi:Serine/threonine-protein phosphatase 2A activator [Oopsacas minuta]|uniref:Serine/threonine-protein phosphatase 2A activator n=1 Tax=Oopsacas minuta TaxID=111878 RepID=A0AAV7K0U4_9METZ|nr:Serine/threonine-protein phosphatase 2A activator [Oopsacas minuta]
MATSETTNPMPVFTEPVKCVLTEPDIDKWKESTGYQDLISFIQYLGKAVESKKISNDCTESPGVKGIMTILDKLNLWVSEIPPEDQPQRFGNKSYRVWHARLTDSSTELIQSILPESLQPALIELRPYLLDSFGNPTRIDYGTGHEASFTIFVLCLMKLGVLLQSDAQAVVTRIFYKYLSLMRLLQSTYRMEPAGSQGVWGLDDFQFLSFIWGAWQLVGQSDLKPESFLDKVICRDMADEYLFFGCIDSINKTKSGPFYEHSNSLWGISSVTEWKKVSSGLLQMYKSDVLCKYPVIQHIPFGTLFSFQKS